MLEAIYSENRFSEIDLLQDLQAILTKGQFNEVLALLSGEDVTLSEATIRKLRRYMLDQEKRHG